MKASSFEKFDYALRPAKNMERKMFCETLGRLSRVAPLSSYRYVGFGAIGFHDFCLFHQRLGIRDMCSIEENTDAKKRVSFNIPYSCIKMRWGESHDVLPTLPWTKRTIIWLDYDKPLNSRKLEDIALVSGILRSGSALIVTVPADPGEVDANADMAEKRLSDLRSRVGKNIPTGVTGKDLVQWGMATVCRRIIVDQIEKTLNDRSAPLEEGKKLRYNQLFNFHYADRTKMLSVGGLIVNARDKASLGPKHFKDLDYFRPEAEPYLIETPILTLREIRYLDERLPRLAPDVRHPKWIPEIERKRYGKVYRYFPSFSEVET